MSIKLENGFDIKDGKVVAVERRGLSVSARISQRKSKKVKVARKGAIIHGKPTGTRRTRGSGSRKKGADEGG